MLNKEQIVMAKVQSRIVQKSLVSWILSKNKKLQLLLVLAAIVSVFANILPLEMQKRIVNEAINLRKFNLLLIYCGIYLAAFVAASGLKFMINSLQTIIGQRTIADMRKELYGHILTLPLSFYRRTQPGLVVAAMTTELATAGDFIGMAVAVLVTNLLMLFAFAGYLFQLNPLLAATTLSIYPVVLLLLPTLQKRVNIYNKKRVDAGRRVSSKIGESIAGIHEIQANGAFSIETSKFDKCVNLLRRIRIKWKLFRYGVKVVNSIFTNLSRFLVFGLGGYLAINGQLELGALVAFLSAQEKLYDPWKELIEFYQAYQTSSVTYKRTMEYFDAATEHALVPEGRDTYDLDNGIAVEDLSFVAEDGTRLLSEVNFTLNPGEHMALVGFSGSGKSTLAHCIVQLYKYTDGRISIGRHDVAALSKKDIISNIGFVSQTPFIFEGTIEDNLLYAHLAQINGKLGDEGTKLPSLDRKIEILQQCGIFLDVLRFGLNTRLNHDQHQDLKSQIIVLREKFLREFAEKLSDYIEYYDKVSFLLHASIAENLMFGTPLHESLEENNLHTNEFFLDFLEAIGLKKPLIELGADLTNQAVETFGDFSPSAVLAKRCPIAPQEMEDCKILVKRLKKGGIAKLGADDRRTLLKLALRYSPGQHKLIGLPRHFEELVLKGRNQFRKKISTENPESVSFYERSAYIDPLSILSNIFFGNITTDSSRGQERINQSINQLLIQEEILETILAMGMQHQVGRSGENLSGGQRQKLAIARVLLKEPKVLVMDEATSGLDNESQARIQNLLETQWKDKTTLIAVVHRLDIIRNYDRIAVMKAGKIIEMGTYDKLMDKHGILRELVHGK
jgi:ABC-type multidrug transport system fused ATPase/permease subunit